MDSDIKPRLKLCRYPELSDNAFWECSGLGVSTSSSSMEWAYYSWKIIVIQEKILSHDDFEYYEVVQLEEESLAGKCETSGFGSISRRDGRVTELCDPT